RARRRLAEIRRRIRRCPNQSVHYRGLAYFAWKEGRYRDVEAVCLECQRRWPKLWWARIGLACAQAKQGKAKEARDGLAAWCAAQKSFPIHVLVAIHQFDSGDPRASMATIRKGLAFPSELLDAVHEAGEIFGISEEYFLWEAALLAYRSKEYALALRV